MIYRSRITPEIRARVAKILEANGFQRRPDPDLDKHFRPSTVPTPRPDPPSVDPTTIWGPKRWAELSMRPRLMTDPTSELQYLHKFRLSIPCGSCREGYDHLVKMVPPNLTSRLGYAKWIWWLHNQVNIKLGKPIVPYEHGVEKYGWPLADGDSKVALEADPVH